MAKSSGIKFPADKVERWNLDKLRPFEKNPRVHSDHQVELIANAIKEWGWTIPVLADPTGEILAGHGRVLAARKLGMKDVPVIIARGWTAAQKRAYVIWDNNATLQSSWDDSLLRENIEALQLADFDMALVGYDEAALADVLAVPNAGLVDPDAEAPAIAKKPVVRTGDLWTIGTHRILCGDSTNASDVARLMDGQRAALMNTDPPYGINYGDIANSRSRAASVRNGGNGKDYGTHDSKKIENDDLDGAQLQAFLECVIRTALPHLIDKPAFYLWHPMLTQGTFFAAAAAADILIHRQIIWVKPSLIMGRGDYHWRHELCFYGWIRGKRCAWLAGRDQDTVWEIKREQDGIHPTQKPVELFVRPIENHTTRGGAVYEPFSGSGSQIIAAEMTGRRCFAIEIDPAYVQVAIERWQTFTGQQATLDGRTLEQIAKARRKGRPKGETDAADAPPAPASASFQG